MPDEESREPSLSNFQKEGGAISKANTTTEGRNQSIPSAAGEEERRKNHDLHQRWRYEKQ